MVELARDFINSLLKAQKKPSPVDLPFSSGLSSNLGGGLADHVLSLRTQNINIKLLQLPLSHSPGVDRWWKEDLLLLQGPRSPGIASRTHALTHSISQSASLIPERGAQLLAFCLLVPRSSHSVSLRGYSACLQEEGFPKMK